MKLTGMPTSVLAALVLLLSACGQPLVPDADRSPNLAAQFDSGTISEALGTASYRYGTYVVGHSGFNFGDAVVLKVNGRGNLIWRRQFGTSNGVRDRATHVATDPQDNVYVLGETYGDLAQPVRGETDFFLRKYSATGAIVWTRQFGLDKTDHPWDVEVSGNSVYVLGLNNEVGTAIYRFNKESGGTSWKKTLRGVFNFAADGSSNLYLAMETIAACTTESGSCQYAVVKKLNSFGKVVWSKTMRLGGPGEVARNHRFRDVALYGGSLYLVGDAYGETPNNEHPAYLVKMDTAGAVKWQQRIGLWEGWGVNYSYFFSTYFGLSADGTGVYVRAVTQYDSSTDIVYSYAKYGPDGTRLWKVGSDGYKSDSYIYGSLNALDTGADSTLYLAGWVNGGVGAFLKRVNPVTGAVIWSR